MSIAIGIDFGTTNTVVAALRGGDKPEIVRTSENLDHIPSVVCLDSKTQELYVGQQARDWMGQESENTICSIKRLMGMLYYDEAAIEKRQHQVDIQNFEQIKAKMGYRIVPEANCQDDGVRVMLGGKQHRPEDISAMILRRAKEEAERHFKEKVSGAVVTVPAYFDEKQKSATLRAGKLAELEILAILEEPVAAAIAAGSLNPSNNHYVLVYNFGGGTFDASLLQVHQRTYRVRGIKGNNWLGGDNFDEELLQIVADRIKVEHHYDPMNDSDFRTRVKPLVEAAKITLSYFAQAVINAPYCCTVPIENNPTHRRPVSVHGLTVTRAQYEERIGKYVAESLKCTQDLLLEMQTPANLLDAVLLVGGPTMTPCVRSAVERTFLGKVRAIGEINPMTCVAQGAALFAAQKTNNTSDQSANEFLASHELQSQQKVAKSDAKESTIDERTSNNILYSIDCSRNEFADEDVNQVIMMADRFMFGYGPFVDEATRNRIETLVKQAHKVLGDPPSHPHEARLLTKRIYRELIYSDTLGSLLFQAELLAATPELQPEFVTKLRTLCALARTTCREHPVKLDDLHQVRKSIDVLVNCALRQLQKDAKADPKRTAVSRHDDEMVKMRKAEVPTSRIDKVHFSVSSPPAVQPGQQIIVDVSAHLERQRAEVVRRIQQASLQINSPPVIRPKGPFKIERGTTLFVRLKFPGLRVEPAEDVILWDGEIGNATFEVTAPTEISEGLRIGSVTVHCEGGLQIARIPLQLLVATKIVSCTPTTQPLHHIRKAFASYASPDREDVLASIQGMQKIDPELKVFYDEANLRSGSNWEQELKRVIPEHDVLYLFWSAAAKASHWVEMEWRCALNSRGIEFIDPVPLVSPEDVPPPEELSGKHFKDWVLAYRRRKPNTD